MAKQMRIGKISTIEGISHEYQKVYRLTRRGEIDLDKGRALAYMLKQLCSIISDSDIEKRLEALENG